MKTELLQFNEKNVEKCVDLVKRGEIIAFPTETVYGLGASAFDEKAVGKIFIAKGRPQTNPLTVHVANIEQIEQVAEITDDAKKLIDAFMPAPLTIILKAKKCVIGVVTAGGDTVGVRMPKNDIALVLIEKTGAIVGTSANSSARPSPTKPEHVLDDLGGKVPVVLDGEVCDLGVESTIISLIQKPTILRLGSISAEQIEVVIEKEVSFASVQDNSKVPANYTPKIKVVPMNGLKSIIEKYDTYILKGKKVAIICGDDIASQCGDRQTLVYGSSEREYASKLFDLVRQAEKEYDVVIAEGCGETAQGNVIMSRLNKMADNA